MKVGSVPGGKLVEVGGEANEVSPKKNSALPPPSGVRGRAGLCDSCEHARRIESDRGSVFYLCELSSSDSRFPKYPPLPVIQCPGYKPKI
jgi:hypothetical protein